MLADSAAQARQASIGDCLCAARARLPRREADLLVGHALEVPRSALYAFVERLVASAAAERCAAWVDRRARGEPVPYILGRREFWGMELEVSPAALIPRPDTETLVAAVLPHIRDGMEVLDVGTGCGAVALAIAAERPAARVTATDIDPQCVALCRRNAARLGLRLNTAVADGLEGLPRSFDMIVSNPPYVADDDPHLRVGDLRCEPRRALVGGPDGLDFIARLVREAPDRLRPGGWLCIEHGWDQSLAVRELCLAAGLRHVRGHRDIEDRPRVMVGQRPSDQEQP